MDNMKMFGLQLLVFGIMLNVVALILNIEFFFIIGITVVVASIIVSTISGTESVLKEYRKVKVK